MARPHVYDRWSFVEKAVRRGRSSLDRSGYSRKTTGFLSNVWLTGEGVADQPAA